MIGCYLPFLRDPSVFQQSCLPARQAHFVVSVKLVTQFRLVVLTQFCGFPFVKIRSFVGKFDMVGKLFLSSHFALEEGTIFENKFFMPFIIF